MNKNVMNKKIFLFNGPPSSGKDYAAKYVVKHFPGTRLDKFARILKERTHALYGMHWKAWDYYEDSKDVPSDDFLGLTPRQAYIGVSENYFKVMHNKRVFGEFLVKDIENDTFETLVISDSGFKEEADVLIEKYGAENIMLIRVHRDGYNFEGDSRSYLKLPVKELIDIHNDGSPEYLTNVYNLVYDFIHGPLGTVISDESTVVSINTPNFIHGPLGTTVSNESTDPKEEELNNSPNRIFTKCVDQAPLDKDGQPPILETKTVYESEPVDQDEQDKDYVFEDIVNGGPSLLTRFKRLLRLK